MRAIDLNDQEQRQDARRQGISGPQGRRADMGDVVMRSPSAGWRRWIASAAVFSVLIGADGTVLTPAPRAEASPRASKQSPTSNQAEVKPAQGNAAEIRSLDLREGAPDVFVDLEANAPLVWTSFRNADGRVVVELPNAVPGPKVVDLAPEEGLVSSLTVQKSEEGSRPLTRLVIATRQEVEPLGSAEGTKPRIQLLPINGPGKEGKGKLPFEPLHEEPAAAGNAPKAAEPPAAQAAPAPASPAPAPAAGTSTPSTPSTPSIVTAAAGTP